MIDSMSNDEHVTLQFKKLGHHHCDEDSSSHSDEHDHDSCSHDYFNNQQQ